MDDTNPKVINPATSNWPMVKSARTLQLTRCQSTLISPCIWILSNTTTLSTYDTSNISFLFSLAWQVLGHSIMNDNFIPKLPEISKCQDFHYILNMAEKKPLWLYSIIRPLTSGPIMSPHRCRIYKPTKSNFFLQLLQIHIYLQGINKVNSDLKKNQLQKHFIPNKNDQIQVSVATKLDAYFYIN